MDISEEVKDYISYIRLKTNIDDVFKAAELGNFEFVTKKDGIYELVAFGETILENRNDIRNNFIKICRNILMKSSEVTKYDVDFMIIGFCQETQYVGACKFIENVINISETYPIHKVQTPFENSIVYKYYEGEHLEYLKEVLDKD